MKNCAVIMSFLLLALSNANAQSVAVNNDNSLPDPSALLDLKSTTKGLLVPRMDFGLRNLIGAPATGLLIYQTNNTPGFYYHTGLAWTPLLDNLGNHIMTKNITSNSFFISKTGVNQGIQMLDNGAVSIRTKNIVNGITTEAEAFRFDTVGNILAVGKALDAGNSALAANKIPATGAGTRFMWFAARGSLRFGRVPVNNSTVWDDANMDDFTFAGGNDVSASGYGAFAYGDQVHVSSTVGVGFGSAVKVTGTAGFGSGASNVVGGFCATTMGYSDSAMGQGSVAFGYRVTAKEDYSTAIGYRGRALHEGALVLSDASYQSATLSTYTTSSAANQFTARYAGGYRLFTNDIKTIGVSLTASDNSWNIISDSTKKERYLPADADAMLTKIKSMRLGSWNYKDYKDRRHYGPMAQEFHAAFGTDAYGNFGNDTTISQADMEGVMMIMLQALEKRTALQQDENIILKAQLAEMIEAVKSVKDENAFLKEQLADTKSVQKQLSVLQQQLDEMKGLAISQHH